MAQAYKPNEMMTIAAARALRNTDVCFVGIGMPSAACNLARLSHAPDITLIYESGTLATKPSVLPLSIGDGELCDTALTTVSVPEMFRYWLQGGRITLGFLGGAQIDRFANLNTTVVGPLVFRPSFARESPPSPCPSDVMKSSLPTKLRFDCAMMMKISPQALAISGAPPPPGSRTLGLS